MEGRINEKFPNSVGKSLSLFTLAPMTSFYHGWVVSDDELAMLAAQLYDEDLNDQSDLLTLLETHPELKGIEIKEVDDRNFVFGATNPPKMEAIRKRLEKYKIDFMKHKPSEIELRPVSQPIEKWRPFRSLEHAGRDLLAQMCKENRFSLPIYEVEKLQTGKFQATVYVLSEKFVSDTFATRVQAIEDAGRVACIGLYRD